METVTEQPIKKIEFFRCPQSLPGVAPLTKKPEDSGYENGLKTEERDWERNVDARFNMADAEAQQPPGKRR